MSQEIGFDVISDLNLKPDEDFNWEGKSSSIYCLVAGNISSDMITVSQTLEHLSKFYQCVFYIPGTLEYEDTMKISDRTNELLYIIKNLPKVEILHQNIALIDGIAIVGVNGWNDVTEELTVNNLIPASARYEDVTYIYAAIERLQRHLDIKNIIVVSNAVPDPSLYFGEAPSITEIQTPLNYSLKSDTEHKIKHWVFGSYGKYVNNRNDYTTYIHNPYIRNSQYYPSRITITY